LGYCSVDDVRVLTGVDKTVLSDADIEGLITLSDQQIDDDLGSFSSPYPTRIKHLSALLTAIKIYTRPDLRGGFSVGGFSVTNQEVEEALNRWTDEVKRIYAYYGKALNLEPSSLKRV